MNENKFYLQKIDFMKIKLKIKKSLQKTGVFPEAIQMLTKYIKTKGFNHLLWPHTKFFEKNVWN